MTVNRAVEPLKAGDKFGRWTVMEDQRYPFIKKVRCKCACTKERATAVENLRNGRSKSCGCINKEILAASGKKRRKHHLKPGDVYGRLTVVNADDYNRVECTCVCGNTTYPSASALYGNNTRSCGCLHRDLIKELGKKHQVADGLSDHTLYGTWQRKVQGYTLIHEPWRNNPTRFIKDVEQEIGPRPAGRWFRLKHEEQGVVPGNIYWGVPGLNKGQKVYLTSVQKHEIAEQVAAGAVQYQVAQAYGVSASLVSSICKNPKYTAQ
jgi:hypothetical protein